MGKSSVESGSTESSAAVTGSSGATLTAVVLHVRKVLKMVSCDRSEEEAVPAAGSSCATNVITLGE